MKYTKPLVSICILDFNRPKESELLLNSLKQNAKFSYELVYVSNGGEQDYVKKYYDDGLIDVLVLNKKNVGCGLGMKQCFKSASGEYVMIVQVDQWLKFEITQENINDYIRFLKLDNTVFYIDLAGNQGQGRFSERAGFINRERYLAIPELEEGIGGPGPYADSLWSEEAIQNHLKKNNFYFVSHNVFGDNGKNSIRDYPCGGQLLLETDTKKLFIIKPIKEKIDFPNLKLTHAEWDTILKNEWINGTVPELHRDHSFLCWNKPFEMSDLKG